MLWRAGQFPAPDPPPTALALLRLTRNWLSSFISSVYLFLLSALAVRPFYRWAAGLREVRTPALSHTAGEERNQVSGSDPLTPPPQAHACAHSQAPALPRSAFLHTETALQGPACLWDPGADGTGVPTSGRGTSLEGREDTVPGCPLQEACSSGLPPFPPATQDSSPFSLPQYGVSRCWGSLRLGCTHVHACACVHARVYGECMMGVLFVCGMCVCVPVCACVCFQGGLKPPH